MWPFTRGSPLERELTRQYAATLEGCGLPSAEARRTTKRLLAIARQQARSDPDLPPDFGELLLQRGFGDDATSQILARKRAEGVTDADIKWWWALDKLERRLLIAVDDWFRMAAWHKYRAEGMSEEKAITQLRRCFPIFGDPEDTKNVNGDDRPLPFELKERISQWALKNDSAETLSGPRQATSMNAVIRSEIKVGRL